MCWKNLSVLRFKKYLNTLVLFLIQIMPLPVAVTGFLAAKVIVKGEPRYDDIFKKKQEKCPFLFRKN